MNSREQTIVSIAQCLADARIETPPNRDPREWQSMLHDANDALHSLSADAQALERRCNEFEHRAHEAEAQSIAVAHGAKTLADNLADAYAESDLLSTEVMDAFSETRAQVKRGDGLASDLAHVIVQRDALERDLERTRHELVELRGDYAASEAWRRGVNRDLEYARDDAEASNDVLDLVREALGVHDGESVIEAAKHAVASAAMMSLRDRRRVILSKANPLPSELKRAEEIQAEIDRRWPGTSKIGKKGRAVLRAAQAYHHNACIKNEQAISVAMREYGSAVGPRKAKART